MAPSNHLKEEKALFSVSPSDPGIRLFGTLIAPPLTSPYKMEDNKLEKRSNYSPHSPRRAVPTPAEMIELNDPTKPLPKVCGAPVPCPRCNSLNTKFCYYNNYNVNQPRRFCKSCHRYWTEGGNLRSVPVGSGRRKSKGKKLSLPVPVADDGAAFLRDHSYVPAKPHAPDGIGPPYISKAPPTAKEEEKEERFDPIKASASAEIAPDLATAAVGGYYLPSPFGIVPPWPSYAPDAGFPLAMAGALGYTSTTKDPHWNAYGGAVPWAMTPWNVAPTNTTMTPPTLKWPLLNPYNGAEASTCAPKTLRINDPTTAAESSILHTLGLHMRSDRGIFFNGLKPKGEVFQPKPIEKMAKMSQNPSGCANPGAFSRSAAFRELH